MSFLGLPLDFFRRAVGLTESYLRVLRESDFRIVNDVMGTENCYFSSLAADLGVTVTKLARKMNLDPRKMSLADRPTFLELYRYAGKLFKNDALKNAQIEFRGGFAQYQKWVNQIIQIGECIDFTLAYETSEFIPTRFTVDVNRFGHITKARAFKSADGRIRTLIIDYQAAPDSKFRFSTDAFLNRENIFNIEIISPIDTSTIPNIPNLYAHFEDLYRAATDYHAYQGF